MGWGNALQGRNYSCPVRIPLNGEMQTLTFPESAFVVELRTQRPPVLSMSEVGCVHL